MDHWLTDPQLAKGLALMTDPLQDWLSHNGEITLQHPELVSLSPVYSNSWKLDPKHLAFVLSRYKFVGKMLKGVQGRIAEIGACDGFGAAIVEQEVGHGIELFDIAPLSNRVAYHDILGPEPLKIEYDAIFTLDLIEHLKDHQTLMENLHDELSDHGKLIIGTPSLESQQYASEISKSLHVHCLSGEELRSLCSSYFHHVFIFGMNDEVVHTGFLPMAHYLFAVCAEPK